MKSNIADLGKNKIKILEMNTTPTKMETGKTPLVTEKSVS